MTQLQHMLEHTDKLKHMLGSYELRPSQIQMAQAIAQSLEEGKFALVEAPAGTGKTLAYLLPALDFARRTGKRIVISTHTLPLQEQILKRDLPLACEILGLEVKAHLLKGMSNYLCLRKAHHHSSLAGITSSDSSHSVLANWVKEARTGLRSEGPAFSNSYWQTLCAGEDCSRSKCPYYQNCYYFSSRHKAQEASMVIINHHLLATEWKRREQDGQSILGSWDCLIIDEAHHLIDVATNQLALRMSEQIGAQLLSKFWICPKNEPPRGWLAGLKVKLAETFSQTNSFDSILESAQLVIGAIDSLWQGLSAVSSSAFRLVFENHVMGGQLLLKPDWSCDLGESMQSFKNDLESYLHALNHLQACLTGLLFELGILVHDLQLVTFTGLLQEGQAFLKMVDRQVQILLQMLHPYDPKTKVMWLECLADGKWQCQLADFDIGVALRQALLEPSHAVVLCSATLGGGQNFEPLYSELRLDHIQERICPLKIASSFNWQQQSRLLVCQDAPAPNEKGYFEAIDRTIDVVLEKCQGRVLILTTAIETVRYLYEGLRLRWPSRPMFCQGQASREQLLYSFTNEDKGVLIGADSFWEGIDLAGHSLKCVVLTRLPFDVPSDPLINAKAQALYGKQAFWEYLLPRAVLRFQQGMGRLLRHSKDKGCVICLDTRLIHARYGRRFLQASEIDHWQKVSRNQLAEIIGPFLSES